MKMKKVPANGAFTEAMVQAGARASNDAWSIGQQQGLSEEGLTLFIMIAAYVAMVEAADFEEEE